MLRLLMLPISCCLLSLVSTPCWAQSFSDKSADAASTPTSAGRLMRLPETITAGSTDHLLHNDSYLRDSVIW